AGLIHRIIKTPVPRDRGEPGPGPARIQESLERHGPAPAGLAADKVPLLKERENLDAPSGTLQILRGGGVESRLPLIRAENRPGVTPNPVVRETAIRVVI